MSKAGQVRRRINPVIVVRLLSQVVVDPQSGCWLIPGREDKYRRIHAKAEGLAQQAHRYVYETFVGLIAPGLVLDHVCGKRGCLNPFHLEPVTAQMNTRRGRSGLKGVAKTHCVHGHPLSGENLNLSFSEGRGVTRRCKACAKERTKRLAWMRAEARKRARQALLRSIRVD